MIGWRKCEGCKRELPEECFRAEIARNAACAIGKQEERNPVYRIAPGIIATPREPWAQKLLARLR
jgi:hypothetical protein